MTATTDRVTCPACVRCQSDATKPYVHGRRFLCLRCGFTWHIESSTVDEENERRIKLNDHN